MSELIIIADSSSTIQKVVKITLSEGPYDVEVCNKEDELLDSISSGIDATIILDSQFAEEGCVSFVDKLQDINSNLLFVILYASRDTEIIQSLANLDTCEFIEKPFEGDELTAKCKLLSSKRNKDHSPLDENDFSERISDEWKISVPGIIGHAEKEQLDIPEIIQKNSVEKKLDSIDEFKKVEDPLEENNDEDFLISTDDHTQEFSINDFANAKLDSNTDNDQFPDDSDLEFPDPSDDSNKPSFESLDNLNLDDDTSTNIPGLQLEEYNDDEEEEGSWTENDANTFWTPDSNTKERDLEDLDKEFKQEEFFAANNDIEPSNVDINQIMEQMKPMMEKLIKEHCHQAVEKIAWEVIPDLAENLIRSELKSIKDEVLEDS